MSAILEYGCILEEDSAGFSMANVNTSVNKSGDVSSDGEDDFESADEGEGKEKVDTISLDTDVSTSGIVRQNCHETVATENVEMTGNVSKGMRNIGLKEPNLDASKSTCRETNNLESTENILETSPAPPSPPVDVNIGSSYNAENVSKVDNQ